MAEDLFEPELAVSSPPCMRAPIDLSPVREISSHKNLHHSDVSMILFSLSNSQSRTLTEERAHAPRAAIASALARSSARLVSPVHPCFVRILNARLKFG